MEDDVFFSGRVTRLYSDREGAFIQLNSDIHYYLILSHENYDAIFSMALSAAVNGVTFGIRISRKKYKDQYDLIEYVTMNFGSPK